MSRAEIGQRSLEVRTIRFGYEGTGQAMWLSTMIGNHVGVFHVKQQQPGESDIHEESRGAFEEERG